MKNEVPGVRNKGLRGQAGGGNRENDLWSRCGPDRSPTQKEERQVRPTKEYVTVTSAGLREALIAEVRGGSSRHLCLLTLPPAPLPLLHERDERGRLAKANSSHRARVWPLTTPSTAMCRVVSPIVATGGSPSTTEFPLPLLFSSSSTSLSCHCSRGYCYCCCFSSTSSFYLYHRFSLLIVPLSPWSPEIWNKNRVARRPDTSGTVELSISRGLLRKISHQIAPHCEVIHLDVSRRSSQRKEESEENLPKKLSFFFS